MNGFRLYSVEIDNRSISTERIKLVDDFKSSNGNYFSLIVGNNGTGKSRILSGIARIFNGILKNETQPIEFRTSHLEFNKIPSKIIAITNSISDKFPIDESFRPLIRDNRRNFHKDFTYNYLGTRNRGNSFSNRALINRALEIVFESYSELDVSRNYRHIFDYLDYEPIIKLNYKFAGAFFDRGHPINQQSLIDFVKERYNNTFFSRDSYLMELVITRAGELCDFIQIKLEQYSRENELMINFSEKNIGRIQVDHSLYSSGVYEYELLDILRKVGLIRPFEIQVFKKGGKPFNFKEASSGEANILSTLLSLTPLLRDSSLILIDEPEISLHPQWQAKYIDLLNKILENVSGCHIIIASHSPFLASDLKPDCSAVISLFNKKGTIQSRNIEQSTYGWSAEDILLNVFGMQSTRNINLYEYVSKALMLLADNNRSSSELAGIQYKLSEFFPSILDSDPMKAVIKAILDANNK